MQPAYGAYDSILHPLVTHPQMINSSRDVYAQKYGRLVSLQDLRQQLDAPAARVGLIAHVSGGEEDLRGEDEVGRSLEVHARPLFVVADDPVLSSSCSSASGFTGGATRVPAQASGTRNMT